MPKEEQIVTKAEFARLSNVSPGRVSQWIKDGPIKLTSLVGTGRHAKINVALAQADLRGNLDPAMARNEKTGGTNLTPRKAVAVPSDPEPKPADYRNRSDLPDDFARGALYGAHAVAHSMPTLVADALRDGGAPFATGLEIYQEQRGEYAHLLVSTPLRALGLIGEEDQDSSPYDPTQFLGLSDLGWRG